MLLSLGSLGAPFIRGGTFYAQYSSYIVASYRTVQNFGRIKLWRIRNCKKIGRENLAADHTNNSLLLELTQHLADKTLVNC